MQGMGWWSWCGVVVCLVGCGGKSTATDAGTGVPPSAAHLTFECPQHAVGAWDAARSLIPGLPVPCTVHVGDRDGAPLAGVKVQLLAEAGRVAVDPVSSAAGDLDVAYETAMPAPLDVSPGTFTWSPLNDATHTGEYLAPLWMEPFHWVVDPRRLAGVDPATRTYTLQEPQRPDPVRVVSGTMNHPTNNPRDGLVTLIAVVSGEEAFTDDNGNGRWDPGEAWVDQTEPFVDANDDGTWTEGEAFVDVNGNGAWDGKNGVWDSATKIWVQERVLWTGALATEDSLEQGWITGARAVVRVTPATIALTCGGSPCVQEGPPVHATLFIADPWFNALPRLASSDGCTLDAREMTPLVNLESFVADNGVRTTWPSGDVATFTVADVRDPTAPLSQQRGRVPGGLPFHRSVTCQFTPSPGAQTIKVTVPVTGTVE
jgi:hypothetical protein